MQITSQYFNYYNVKGHYTPETPQTPTWRKTFEVVDDRVESNNRSQESDLYKAYVKLEEIYHDVAVSNRAKYQDKESLMNALEQKYSASGPYSQYSRDERMSMFRNEMNMTMYGVCSDFTDPRLGGPVMDTTDEEKAAYNRQMVNTQISNILTNAGLDISLLGDMVFSIEPFNHTLTVLGLDDEKASLIERLLNDNRNSTELFHHIMQSNRSRIDADVRDKYLAIRDFKEKTGEDLRTYRQTAEGFVDASGRNALDVYKAALKTTDSVPAQFKGVVLEVFSGNLQTLMNKDFDNIPDLVLQIGFSNGELNDGIFNPVVTKGLDISV